MTIEEHVDWLVRQDSDARVARGNVHNTIYIDDGSGFAKGSFIWTRTSIRSSECYGDICEHVGLGVKVA